MKSTIIVKMNGFKTPLAVPCDTQPAIGTQVACVMERTITEGLRHDRVDRTEYTEPCSKTAKCPAIKRESGTTQYHFMYHITILSCNCELQSTESAGEPHVRTARLRLPKPPPSAVLIYENKISDTLNTTWVSLQKRRGSDSGSRFC